MQLRKLLVELCLWKGVFFVMEIKWKKLLLCLVIPLAAGGLSALVSGGMDSYGYLRQPPLSPPGWVFPVVWSILYLLMGYASYRVLTSNATHQEKKTALILYGIQLALNFLWSPVFFGLHWYLAAFFVLVAMWAVIYRCIKAFAVADEIAGDLLIPYILWVTFAGYLNFGVYFLNR